MNALEPTSPPDPETAADKALAVVDWFYDWSDDIHARERGYRSYQKAIDALEVVALQDRDKAQVLWERYAPGEAQAPAYLREGEALKRQNNVSTETQELSQRDGEPVPQRTERVAVLASSYVPKSVNHRYLQAGSRFYYRDRERRLAFEDSAKSLSSPHEDVHVIRAMVDIAEARGWTSVRIKGSTGFKRAAWLEASLRGLEVQGVQPDDLDRAKLEDARRAGIGHGTSSAYRRSPVEADQSLTQGERSTVDVLKAVLRERGDSEVAVDMAAEIARQRFLTNRVYLGQITEIGEAPYQGNPGSDVSPYVRIKTSAGSRQVWGVDLPRALKAGQIRVGDDIVLAFQGKQKVEVTVKTRDADGQLLARKEMVDRNTWEARRLDEIRDEVRQRLMRVANSEPTVQVYDRKAPRTVEPPERIKRSRRAMERTR